MPLAGGVEGHRLGRKVAKAAGLPEEVGGVPGAVIGAIFPGGAITAGLGEHFAGAEGGFGAIALAALARRYGLAGLGPLLRAAATRLPAAAEAAAPAEALAAGGAPAVEAAVPTAAERFAQVSAELKAARDAAGTATRLRAGAASAPAAAPEAAAPAVAPAVTPAAPAPSIFQEGSRQLAEMMGQTVPLPAPVVVTAAAQGAPASRALVLEALRRAYAAPGGKDKVLAEGNRIFGDQWPEILKLIKASRSRPGTVYMPVANP
jgi:hypothetical protein